MTNSTITGELEIRSNETEIDCQNIKNEIMEIMRGSRDKKRLDQVILDFTTDFDIEWVFHNDNRTPYASRPHIIPLGVPSISAQCP